MTKIEIKFGKFDLKETIAKIRKFYQGLSKREKILIGVVLALFLFMSLKDNLFEKKTLRFSREISLMDKEIKDLRDELLVARTKNIDMTKEIEPFKDLAKSQYPDLDLKVGLSRLIDDFGLSKKIIEQYEYIPLTGENKQRVVGRLKNLTSEFSKNRIHVEVTCELWISSEVKALAEEIAEMMIGSGLNASGPTLKTVYKPQMPVYPLAWSYNADQEETFRQLYMALKPIINPNAKHIENKDQPPGTIKIHFAGQVRFDPSGVATIY